MFNFLVYKILEVVGTDTTAEIAKLTTGEILAIVGLTLFAVLGFLTLWLKFGKKKRGK